MAEKVAKLGLVRGKDFMYFVKDGGAWRVRRAQPGLPKGKSEKVADGNFQMDFAYIYFVDKDGDISRAKRAVGGQKRKKVGPTFGKAPRPKKPLIKKAKPKKVAKKKPAAKTKAPKNKRRS